MINEQPQVQAITPPTMHAHRCQHCLANGKQTVWIHGEDKAGLIAEHKCPECGEVQWKKYMVELGRLPNVRQAVANVNNDMDAILVYAVLALAIVFLAYYISRILNKKEVVK
jgi:hypothetical protein